MSIQNTSLQCYSNEYQAWLDTWKKADDFYRGSDAVKNETTTYLRNFFAPDRGDLYETYLYYSYFYPAVKKSVDVFTGMIFRKDPIVEEQEKWEENIKNIDLQGTHLFSMIREILNETQLKNYSGIWIDYQQNKTPIMTISEAERSKLRTVWSYYKAETIINVVYRKINDVNQPGIIILQEEPETNEMSIINSFNDCQYRILALDEENKYFTVVKKEIDFDSILDIPESERIYPLMNGKKLDFIPFIPINDLDNKLIIRESLMKPLIDTNHDHYKKSADYSWSLHRTANPTPYVFGISKEESKSMNCVGAGTIWFSSNPNAKTGYLEFAGQGIEPTRQALLDLETKCAQLGTRILGDKKMVAETAEKAQIDNAGETSVIANLANNVSMAINKAIQISQEWENLGGDFTTVSLNTDFVPTQQDANFLNGLVNAVNSGAMTLDDYFYNLEKGEYIRPGKTFEEFQDGLIVEGNGDIE